MTRESQASPIESKAITSRTTGVPTPKSAAGTVGGAMAGAGRGAGGVGEVRIGYLPLLDAAPLIAAAELGFFAEEGLRVTLERQLGWGNVRDKLMGGHLDAAHSLLGLPLMGAAGAKALDRTVAIMGLGTGGVAITVSRNLALAGVIDGPSFARWMSRRRGDSRLSRPVFGHVFSASVHHYLLRRWLAQAEVDPDREVELCVLPPPQVGIQLEKGHLAGFCAGEPWNTLAQLKRTGQIIALGQEICASHPDKVLAVRRDWLASRSETAVRLVRAVLRACTFCEASANRSRLVELLARPDRLAVSPDVIEASLNLQTRPQGRATAPVRARTFAPASLLPSRASAVWLLGEMRRWGHLDASIDISVIATRVMLEEPYRIAASDLGISVSDAGDSFQYVNAGPALAARSVASV